MIYPIKVSSVLEETRINMKEALAEHWEEIEHRLAEFGLTFADIPTRLIRETQGKITRYSLDGNCLLETEAFFDTDFIRFEVRLP